jgi:transcriptional regulator with XRE-family HTH domain
MPIRHSRLDEAAARSDRQLRETIGALVLARQMANLAQGVVGGAIGVSRSTIASWEQRRVEPTFSQLCRWAAVVGLDASLRTFPAGDPLRDIGQLRLLDRFGQLIGAAWDWRSEVPVTADPRDRRAFDAVIRGASGMAAVEAIVRLVDIQGQVRPIIAKQSAAAIGCVILVLADTRQNRIAAAAGAPTLEPAFPIGSRRALAAVRGGLVPEGNAIVFA